jgi:hypothetical protein
MQVHRYRALVVASILSWFLLGLHFPIVHEISGHGRIPHWPVLVAVATLTLLSAGTLWKLIRVRGHIGS